MKELVEFLKNAIESPWGIFIGSVIASLLATLLYKLIEKYVKKNRAKRWFIKAATSFRYGFRASEAKTSSYKQILYVGDYIVDMLYLCLRIFLTAIIALTFVLVLHSYILWGIPVIVASFIITLDVMKIRTLRVYYNQTIEYIYGKEYMDHEVEAAVNYAENRGNVKEKKHENTGSKLIQKQPFKSSSAFL